MPGTQAICDEGIETPGAQSIRGVVIRTPVTQASHGVYGYILSGVCKKSSNLMNIMR